jgi:hypothetical protein
LGWNHLKEDEVDCSRCGATFSDDVAECPECGTVMKFGRDELPVGVSDAVWLEQRREEKVVGRATSARPPLASGRAELREDGTIHVVVTGHVRRKERGTRDVARILVERLNHYGGTWGEVRCPETSAREERGIDCRAEDAEGNRLEIQVTRADSDQAFYRMQATEGQAEKLYANLTNLVRTWHDRIADKAALAGRDTIVLALDAAEASSTLPDAIDLFRRVHGDWAIKRGFKAIWIVGASWDWTYRLDIRGREWSDETGQSGES